MAKPGKDSSDVAYSVRERARTQHGAGQRRPSLVLASASPQRRAILEALNVSFTVRPTGVAELEQGPGAEVALENALAKAQAAREMGPQASESDVQVTGEGDTQAETEGDRHDAPPRGRVSEEAVLGVDTVVELDSVLYGKPADERRARETLSALSGATHMVHSGVALLLGGERRTAVASTAVTFREIDESLMERCIASGDWRGRSGAYAIQGIGMMLVRRVEGDYQNVVGLPVATLIDLWPQLLHGGMQARK